MGRRGVFDHQLSSKMVRVRHIEVKTHGVNRSRITDGGLHFIQLLVVGQDLVKDLPDQTSDEPLLIRVTIIIIEHDTPPRPGRVQLLKQRLGQR